MSYQEKRSLVSLFSNVLIFGIYYWYLLQISEQNSPPDELRFWSAAILVLLPVLIVCKLVIHMLFNIVNTIATNEREPAFTDELDRLITLRAVRNFCFVFSAGFFLSMGALAIGMPLRTMFEILLFTVIAAGVTIDLSQLYFYRKGV